MANGKYLSVRDSRKEMTRSPVLNVSMYLISLSVNLKSNTSIFSSIRFGVTDLGIGTVPISI